MLVVSIEPDIAATAAAAVAARVHELLKQPNGLDILFWLSQRLLQTTFNIHSPGHRSSRTRFSSAPTLQDTNVVRVVFNLSLHVR